MDCFTQFIVVYSIINCYNIIFGTYSMMLNYIIISTADFSFRRFYIFNVKIIYDVWFGIHTLYSLLIRISNKWISESLNIHNVVLWRKMYL